MIPILVYLSLNTTLMVSRTSLLEQQKVVKDGRTKIEDYRSFLRASGRFQSPSRRSRRNRRLLSSGRPAKKIFLFCFDGAKIIDPFLAFTFVPETDRSWLKTFFAS